jgi:hypothetical protein
MVLSDTLVSQQWASRKASASHTHAVHCCLTQLEGHGVHAAVKLLSGWG